MSILELLRDIEAHGLSLTATGADLRLQGPTERMDADLVGRIRAAKPALIAHLTAPAGHPVTPLQRGYLLGRGEHVELGNTASHVYHEIEGAWDVDRLRGALQAVVDRHPALRTSFTADGRQLVHDDVRVHIRVRDLRALPPAARDEARAAHRERASHRILPADRPPLVRAEVTVLTDDRMVLHVGHDGLVLDGISMFLFFRAWWQAYQGEQAADGDELPLGDYVAELERARDREPARRSRRWWLDRLSDLAPTPDLPLATSPASITRPVFSQRQVRLDAAGWRALTGLAAAHRITAPALLLTAYAQTLAYWGAGERFTVNTTVAHRPPIHPRIFDAIGNFSDTMLVEVALEESATFAQRAAAVQARLHAGVENRHFSGVEVLRELGRRGGTARAPYTFNCAIGYVTPGVDGSALELFGPEVFSVSQTPQVWLNVFAMEQHGGLVVQFDAVDELFPVGLLDGLVAGYQRLLESLGDAAGWAAPTVDLLPPQQRQRRAAANDTAAPQPQRLLWQDIVERARLAPDAPAIITSDATISYGELLRRAGRAAGWLRERHVRRDELVGLVMRRGPEQVVGILATLLAGGAYLPIDAGLPAARQAYLLRDGGVRCVLTNVPGLANAPGLANEPDLANVPGLAAPGMHVRELDADPGPAVHVEPLPDAHPDDLAYVLYTSGTTGDPKGVMVSHRSVANVVADCTARFGVDAGDRFFGISAFNFDLSVYDVFGALSVGAALVLPDADRAADPAHWTQLCASAGVTVWNSVPAIVALLHERAAAAPATLSTLRLVLMSGDRIPPELPASLLRFKPDLEVVSLGGPTETTIWNILHPIGLADDGIRPVPYGRPNRNNRAYVRGPGGWDRPDWVPGEIWAAGVGLARGYHGDPARTAERFPDHGERCYRTGDLGRYLPDGSIEILGRSDFQIKLNGYRIEAGEVETRLVGLASIKQAAVVSESGAHGDRLVAHLAAAGAERADLDAIRAHLSVHLPGYMIPTAVVWHDALPLTRNGKLDRAALARHSAAPAATPQPVASVATGSRRGSEAPAAVAAGDGVDDLETALAQIWATVLRQPDVGPDASFYDLGGDSLAAARVLTEVRKRFRVTIALEQFYEVRTVRAMAGRLRAAAR